jgi:CheY-like chemotaxis protein
LSPFSCPEQDIKRTWTKEEGKRLTKASLVQVLRKTLNHLYDPTVLRESVLVELLGADQVRNPTAELRRILIDAIQSLKPEQGVPPDSNAWRVYRILTYRYVEQFTQRDVAADFALSIRQLRRQETGALKVLADVLWTQYDLEERAERLFAAGIEGDRDAMTPNAGAADRERELERLKSSVPREPTSLPQMTDSVLDTLSPLIQASGVRIISHIPDDLPMLTVQLITMRQALLEILAGAVRYVPGGEVTVSAQAGDRQVRARVRAVPASGDGASADDRASEGAEVELAELAMVRKLVEISGGSLEVSTAEFLAIQLVLPAEEQVTVLAVDDNRDTLRLWQKYLSGTPYRLVSTTEPREAIALAEQWSPQVIVLDVMLPEVDGWELLSSLREHPRTCDIPAIVCTILAEKELALLLGAADFVRKPVSQQDLLAALERQVSGLQQTESR